MCSVRLTRTCDKLSVGQANSSVFLRGEVAVLARTLHPAKCVAQHLVEVVLDVPLHLEWHFPPLGLSLPLVIIRSLLAAGTIRKPFKLLH